ncbi:serine hydrolase [Aerolutibacter ruishenii]|uniref:CubicO group peptidase (Beta-lactamase class C family) n=1 Tax=Aerolutibacter ruishenii TaxID=686800 RepID=A0A562LW62_9GAMM|nr:serine hydrolase [Lysobacter ruishenii]TWI11889.1 CubicO group peptidase (beta-lactamase class C family) [Lysobacter ruishenii]
MPRMIVARSALASLALALSVAIGCACAAQGGVPRTPTPVEAAAIDRVVDDVVRHYQLPGIAVGVVVGGDVVYRGTRGELAAGRGQPVDADTLFKVASLTKAMTTAVLARLVDAGTLDWHDPVIGHLPHFRMHDPWVTRHMQVRDLLIHNSGLGAGAGDLMLWPEPNAFTRDDIVAGLAHLKPLHGLRERYAYDNLLYVVAGEVAAAAAGKPYAQLVREHVFQPLDMGRCQVGSWSRDAVGNIAQPHMRQDGRNVAIRTDGAQVPDVPSMAAGGVRCSLDDMLKWVRAWLQEPGIGQPWLSQAQRTALWTLHTPMPISQRMRDWDGTRMYGYGYGWRVSDVEGHWKVAHTGTLMGMYASLVLLPDQDLGFVFLINGEAEQARTVLEQALLKHFIRPPGEAPGVAHYAALLDQDRQSKSGAAARVPDTSSRRPAKVDALEARVGLWRDPWFGDVELCADGTDVRFRARRSPHLDGRVMQVGQRWLVDWDEASVDAEPWLAFDEDASGRPRMRLSHVDPSADFSYDYADLDFTRVGDCGPRDAR